MADCSRRRATFNDEGGGFRVEVERVDGEDARLDEVLRTDNQGRVLEVLDSTGCVLGTFEWDDQGRCIFVGGHGHRD